ncbi:MAG: alpha-glucuronidase, partial [Prevotellaceae bacterium]|nr:alpha-glucuronidase [Prevotellaceae bacterium]
MKRQIKKLRLPLFTFVILVLSLKSNAEDGSRLWLPADANTNAQVSANKKSPTITIAIQELQKHWYGTPIQLIISSTKKVGNLGNDGFIISGNINTGLTITALTEYGLLYGAYHLLRLQATQSLPAVLNITESPKYARRILNHWDNLDRSIERGYAGRSLWEWEKMPDEISPRYAEYARANASVGINGSVLNNVNANPQILTPEY